MTTTARSRPTASLSTNAAFLASLATTTAQCEAVLAVKGPAAKIIPIGIRAQMRVLFKLNAYWIANKAAYAALLEASAATPAGGGTKAQRAGA